MATNDIPEMLKIFVDVELRKFMNDCNMQQYEFSENLTNPQRKYLHKKCRLMGLVSKSYGKEPHRRLQIQKPHKLCDKVFYLAKNNRIKDVISEGICSYNHKSLRLNKKLKMNGGQYNGKVFDALSPVDTINVSPAKKTQYLEFRKCLPVWSYKRNILEALDRTQTVMITSETGSGKTTQIPQFILENACEKGLHCKIICTQPRRLSTVTVAERVAAERGETAGGTVGYQIKLESQVGVASALVYCTNGVLLRTLMNGPQYLLTTTHIIVDEIHERDKYSDFLLIALKQNMRQFPHLKIILMSATVDCQLFMGYFETNELLNIPGKLFPVSRYFLDDILVMLNYGYKVNEKKHTVGKDLVTTVDTVICDDMTSIIQMCVRTGDENMFMQMISLILNDNGNVNHQTPDEGYTPLMAAAMHGNVEITEQLLNLGADVNLRCYKLQLTAYELCSLKGNRSVCNIINHYSNSNMQGTNNSDVESLLKAYDSSISDEIIDFDLIVRLIKYIHEIDTKGTIIVFLPGYEDIICCQDKISSSVLNLDKFEIFILHGSMSAGAQRNVFKIVPNRQKIILSTNIAETSITICDIVYVIDTGKVREKTYDSLSGISGLQKVWISKASAQQRAGRGGRVQPGLCFHIYSKQRYNSLEQNHTPEILRVSLHELCLQTKMVAPANVNIAEFLQNAIEPPSTIMVENSIEFLKTLGALDTDESLTPLGKHLLRLSVDPRLGKMLIYAAILKCLDPILSIVAILSYKDPFILPTNPKLKRLATEKQKEFSGDFLSDHYGLLRSYQMWQDLKSKGLESVAMTDYFINTSAMEMISATRTQLMSQLRSMAFVQTQKPFSVQELNVHSNCWPLVKAVLAVGCYPNIAFYQNNNFRTRTEKKILFNKVSCISGTTSFNDDFNSCVIYEELTKIGTKCSIKCGTVITALAVALVCGTINDNDCTPTSIVIDNWLRFEHNYPHLIQFRLTIHELINARIADQNYNFNNHEGNVLNSLLQVLCMEDKGNNFQEPTEIGLVPKLNMDYDVRYRSRCYKRNNSNNRKWSNTTQNTYSNKSNPTNSSSSWKNEFTSLNNVCATDAGCSGIKNQLTRQNGVKFSNNNAYSKNQEASSCSSGDLLLNAIAASGCTDIISPYSVYFIIRPPSMHSLRMGITKRAWMFSPVTEKLVFKNFAQRRSVILLFSVNKSQEFQGMAKLLDTNHGDVTCACPLQWLSTNPVTHQKTIELNLRNPYTRHALICHGKDGQQIEPNVAMRLCNLFLQMEMVPHQ